MNDQIVNDQIEAQKEKSTPWFIQGLLGCGGWIAAMFFFGCGGIFVGTFFTEDNPTAIMLLGLMMIGGSVALARSNKSIFISQLAIAFHIAGQCLFLIGLNIQLDYNDSTVSIIALTTIIINIIFIAIYPDPIFRFGAIIVIVAATNILIYDLQLTGGLSLLTALITAALLAIWNDALIAGMTRIKQDYQNILIPVGYGLVFGLAGTIAFEQTLGSPNFDYDHTSLDYPIITSILLLPMLLYLAYHIIQTLWPDETAKRVMAVVGGITAIIALPTLSAPGIIAGMLLMILGYHSHRYILEGLSYAFMSGFIIYFYYSLHMTLLNKSLILMTTGVLFLIARFALNQFMKNISTTNTSMEAAS